jgi:hypothetical protein
MLVSVKNPKLPFFHEKHFKVTQNVMNLPRRICDFRPCFLLFIYLVGTLLSENEFYMKFLTKKIFYVVICHIETKARNSFERKTSSDP